MKYIAFRIGRRYNYEHGPVNKFAVYGQRDDTYNWDCLAEGFEDRNEAIFEMVRISKIFVVSATMYDEAGYGICVKEGC